MSEVHLPTTTEGKLDHLIEECTEVIKAICKLRRFGQVATDPETGITYSNLDDLASELRDLERAISRWRAHRR